MPMTQPKSDILHFCAILLSDARFDFFSSTQYQDDRILKPFTPDEPYISVSKTLPAHLIDICMAHLPQESFSIELGETQVKATKTGEIITKKVVSNRLTALYHTLCKSCRLQPAERYQPELLLATTKLGVAKKYAPILKNLPKKIEVRGFMAVDADNNLRKLKLYQMSHKKDWERLLQQFNTLRGEVNATLMLFENQAEDLRQNTLFLGEQCDMLLNLLKKHLPKNTSKKNG
ncbi:MAG: hypothetical protein AAGG80_07665 [Pseudomonadota bacterium]